MCMFQTTKVTFGKLDINAVMARKRRRPGNIGECAKGYTIRTIEQVQQKLAVEIIIEKSK